MTGTEPAQGDAGASNGLKPLMMQKTACRTGCFAVLNNPWTGAYRCQPTLLDKMNISDNHNTGDPANDPSNTETADKAIKAFEKLARSVPDIGFMSRRKRILAYLVVSTNAQRMIDNEEISEKEAIFLLSLLMRKHKNFQKAAMMAALNLSRLDKEMIKPLDRKYLNEVRKHLKHAPID